VDTTVIKVDPYTGAPPLGMTYTAAPQWLTGCNGVVIAFNAPADDPPGDRATRRDSGPGHRHRVCGTWPQLLTGWPPVRFRRDSAPAAPGAAPITIAALTAFLITRGLGALAPRA
jgi:hypothetical protein